MNWISLNVNLILLIFIRDAGYVADNPIYAQAQKLVAVYFYGTRGNETNFYGKYTHLSQLIGIPLNK